MDEQLLYQEQIPGNDRLGAAGIDRFADAAKQVQNEGNGIVHTGRGYYQSAEAVIADILILFENYEIATHKSIVFTHAMFRIRASRLPQRDSRAAERGATADSHARGSAVISGARSAVTLPADESFHSG